jgi:hypothetical protein
MKILYALICACLFLSFGINQAMENQTEPATKPSSSLVSSLKLLGALALEIVSFNPENVDKTTITHFISPNLTIYASEDINICRDDPFFIVEEYTKKQGNKHVYYFDASLEGELYWRQRKLLTKKGNIIHPLVY